MILTFYTKEGGHTPLSNFSESPMVIDGDGWPTVEHYYQAMKTTDPAEREKIRRAQSPGEAKRLGRRVALRPDWEEIKLLVMRRALKYKFRYDNSDGVYLMSTGDQYLAEGNDWNDRFWGVSPAVGGYGQNWLGVLLMARRAELRSDATGVRGASDG